jgi:hypothetical protein
MLRRVLLVSLLLFGALFCLADGAVLAVKLTWPHARFVPGGAALTRIQVAPHGEQAASVRVIAANGRRVPAVIRNGRIVPTALVPGGKRLRVVVIVQRSKWVSWLLGKTETVRTVVTVPAAHLAGTMVYPRAGAPVTVRFNRPVKVLSVLRADGTRTRLRLPVARRNVTIGLRSAGENTAGTALVSGSPRTWVRLPAAIRVNWFPSGRTAKVLVRPAPASRLEPSAPIVLTFSRPVTEILGSDRPVLAPNVTGTWHQPNDNTLVFQPSGLGFPLGRRIHLELPRTIQVIAGSDPAAYKTLTWQVPRGSLLRLQQMLADLGYLPLAWRSAGGPVAATPTAQIRAAVDPPAGKFGWRYATTPAALKGLWASPAERQVILRGAIMAFESTHDMTTDGFPSIAVFSRLLHDELARRRAPGYSYVFVTETLPQTLTLWHNGRVVLRTPVNTGISSRPTALGTYPVYAHLTSTTMSGINPDGTPYNDPGVPWVNYFNGGDAVHGFYRGSYGWPQSLGCVEVPVPTAGEIFPYVNVGTLVTVSA